MTEGDSLGNFTIREELEIGRTSSGNPFRRFSCECSCGNILVKTSSQLGKAKRGDTKGCRLCQVITRPNKLSAEQKHLHSVYNNMLSRCNNPLNNRFHRYGARGIEVCDSWMRDKNAFVSWALPLYSEGLQLDREKNDKGYNPTNCRFITRSENSLNKETKNGHGVQVFRDRYQAYCMHYGRKVYLGTYLQAAEAREAYNNYCVENNLTHTLNPETERTYYN